MHTFWNIVCVFDRSRWENDRKARTFIITFVQANQIISHSYFHQLHEKSTADEPKREKMIWMKSECCMNFFMKRKSEQESEWEVKGLSIYRNKWNGYRNAHYSFEHEIFIYRCGFRDVAPIFTADRRLFAAKRVFICMQVVSCGYFINFT